MDKSDHQPQRLFEAISDKALEDNIEECCREFHRLCDAYKKGIFTRESLRNRFTSVLNKGFEKFVDENNLNLIRPAVQSRWDRFEDDHHLWENGQKPCSKKGNIWLKYLRDSGDGRVRAGDEASCTDKERFFSLMRAFDVPTDYYMPAPEGTVFSNRRLGHFPSDMIVDFGNDWQDDGGLLKEDIQPGSEITLTDRYGLKTTIRITEHLTPEEQRERKVYADYIGNGHIEGYTTNRDREIKIFLNKGGISSLLTEIDNEDRDAFSSFPLWQAEQQYNNEIHRVTQNVVENLIRRFLNES